MFVTDVCVRKSDNGKRFLYPNLLLFFQNYHYISLHFNGVLNFFDNDYFSLPNFKNLLPNMIKWNSQPLGFAIRFAFWIKISNISA
jgi:hypothetical protein